MKGQRYVEKISLKLRYVKLKTRFLEFFSFQNLPAK